MKRFLKRLGIDFRFQWIFRGHERFVIVDFYLPEYRVVLEIDGKDHYKIDGLEYDAKRTQFLMGHGVDEVLRFKNEEVLDNFSEVQEILCLRFADIPTDPLSTAYFQTV